MADFTTDLGFLKLKNPVLVASGTFGYGLEFAPFIDLGRLGGIVVKGLYYGPRPGNPPPRLAETPSGLLNAIGLQGIGVAEFSAKILPKLRGLGTEILINVCGGDEDEYLAVVDYLDKQDGIAAYELNISCPNTARGGLVFGCDPEGTRRVVSAVRATCSLPLIVKLSPNVTDIVAIARVAVDNGADILSLVNTFLGMAVDIERRRPVLANGVGGVSGPAIKPQALYMVHRVCAAMKVPVIGIGGIMTARDALEFLLVGARAIQVGTANFLDPASSVKIVEGIRRYLTERGIPDVNDLVGAISGRPAPADPTG